MPRCRVPCNFAAALPVKKKIVCEPIRNGQMHFEFYACTLASDESAESYRLLVDRTFTPRRYFYPAGDSAS